MKLLDSCIRLPRSAARPPLALPAPRRVTLPLQWGETALVRPGEAVLLGQRIADGAGDTVPVHASVSGTVAAVAPRTCAGGRRCPSIVLENDGEDRKDPSLRPQALLDELSDELLLSLLFEAGIRLPDGTPLAAALADAGPGAETLIVSAMDPEPNLCAEDAAVCYQTEDVLSGIRLLERLLRPRQMVLAVAAGQKAAIRAAARWTGRQLRMAVVSDVYPASHPRLLAELLGGLRPGQTVREAGILVVPASAAADAGRCAYGGMPVVRQTVCVDLGGRCALVDAALGTPVEAVLKAVGAESSQLLLGGPMTGAPLQNTGVPVVKGMSGLTLLPKAEARHTTPCIRCGRCAAVCPAGLRPWESQLRGFRADWRGCLRCGACQYSCPAGLPLLQAMSRRGKEAAGVG